MPSQVTYFDEYVCRNTVGDEFHPMVDNFGNWSICGDPLTLTVVVELCNIPSDEALMLKLKYGG